jgi:NTE family protein
MTALVFSGSGALYPVHLGAAQKLLEAGLVPTDLIGTSGGSIVASFLASGHTPKYGLELAEKITPQKIIGINWSFWRRGHWGLCDLSGLEKALAPHVPPTFGETKIPLHVVTTDINTQDEVVYSTRGTPTASVPKAVRASSTVPFLFAPVSDGKALLVDGGVTDNFAIDMLPGAVGILVHSAGQKVEPPTTLLRFAIAALDCMMRAIEKEHIEDAIYARVIPVKAPWSSMDFWRVTPEIIRSLYQVGYDAVGAKLDAGWRWA